MHKAPNLTSLAVTVRNANPELCRSFVDSLKRPELRLVRLQLFMLRRPNPIFLTRYLTELVRCLPTLESISLDGGRSAYCMSDMQLASMKELCLEEGVVVDLLESWASSVLPRLGLRDLEPESGVQQQKGGVCAKAAKTMYA